MQVFLVRHGIAQSGSAGGSDSERVLSAEGRRRFRSSVCALRDLGVGLDAVCTSPLRRAVETAELFEPILSGPITLDSGLAEAPSVSWVESLERAELGEALGLVGHEPLMGDLCALLLTGQLGQGRAFPFKKGGVAWLEGPLRVGAMSLRAYLPPGVLLRIGH